MVKRISKLGEGEGSPTMRDVALRAGVSQATVSYVLNAKSNARISPTTRQRVLQSAAELRYAPNAIARAMASGRSQTVGVYQPHTGQTPLAGWWTMAVMRGLGEALHPQNFHLLLYGFRDEEEPEPSVFLDGRVDGLILLAPHDDDTLALELAQVHLPTVVVGGGKIVGPSTSSVDVDNLTGAMDAVRYLVSLGHTDIAHLHGPLDSPNAADRREGYLRAVTEQGLAAKAENLVFGGFGEASGYDAACELLRRPSCPTAWLVANDLAAIGAMRACAEFGKRVPEDIALIGYDDAPLCELTHPPLTTMRQPTIEMGCAAAELLLTMLQQSEASEGRFVQFPAELVVRGTSGSDRSGNSC